MMEGYCDVIEREREVDLVRVKLKENYKYENNRDVEFTPASSKKTIIDVRRTVLSNI